MKLIVFNIATIKRQHVSNMHSQLKISFKSLSLFGSAITNLIKMLCVKLIGLDFEKIHIMGITSSKEGYFWLILDRFQNFFLLITYSALLGPTQVNST